MHTGQGQKQHLNLSCYAYEIVQNDIHAFGQSSLSSFLNQVFRQFYETADATVNVVLERRRQELKGQFSFLTDPKMQERACERILAEEEEEILSRIKQYSKGYGFKFYLNVACADILEESQTLIDTYYHQRPMRYFKAVIEEYATHSSLEREQIFFHETIELLQSAIGEGNLVSVETGGQKYDVKPWKILSDGSDLYHYLVGLSALSGDSPDTAIPASFRISRITDLKKRPKSYRSGRLTTHEQETLRSAVNTRGVAFLVGQEEEITLRLTPTGIRRFQNKLFLRPYPIERQSLPNGDEVFTFKCTPYQIESYFFTFGAEAELLSPAHLRERFRQLYQTASELYQSP
jgi:hypothetical protein